MITRQHYCPNCHVIVPVETVVTNLDGRECHRDCREKLELIITGIERFGCSVNMNVDAQGRYVEWRDVEPYIEAVMETAQGHNPCCRCRACTLIKEE